MPKLKESYSLEMGELYKWLLEETDATKNDIMLAKCRGEDVIRVEPGLAADPYALLQVGLYIGQSSNDLVLHTADDADHDAVYCVHVNLKQ